jgi:predicted membrane channel-forming protein YqfA (hemolysin III family)
MQPVVLDTSFWDVVAWMIMAFFAVLFIWMFIAIFADIFRRQDIGGLAKALWMLLIFVIPLIGILLYVIFRPAPTQAEIYAFMENGRAAGASSYADEIAKAHELLESGVINQQEFDAIKRRTIASPA